MPGHSKKSTDPDPDPTPWLSVTPKLRSKLKEKPYDAKKSCWVPDKASGGFQEGLIESTSGDKVTVKLIKYGETEVFKKEAVAQVNPPKFDCSDDMADLTYLSDACVLWNTIVRYTNQLIYTYSGLFCIAVNPYKRFPIYTQRVMDMYIGKRKMESPPHIFGVAEQSYQGMIQAGKNQSILITGESGAGKTENTKKVIAYFASVGASDKKKEGEIGLEEKIVQTNPVLEAWGNAKTVRNDNSSRFGKFIRIWFNHIGRLSGADMVTYLLEKSRITYQAEDERSYHSFYNIMSDAVPDLKEKCLLSNDIYDYHWVSQGKVTVDTIDDKEDMEFADEAYDILGFTKEEKYNIYRLTACVMHMGQMSKDFIPVGKEEQAEIRHEKNSELVAELCGIDAEWMITYFCKPKLKVGAEWVSKGQTCTVASSSVAGVARKIYELVFRFIVDACNDTLVDPTMKKVQYIGCLDIAGFEIFDFNGFEQLCINFCNEKLQQFFNNHMFVLEQEEYVMQGIKWANLDFGMDLSKCIGMFEKQMGLLAILEEESLFPKATDQTFATKLNENLLGKSDSFVSPSPRPDPDAHFAVVHYAAVVSYNLTGWLEKNKDPVNETVVELMKNGTNKLLVEIFKDHPGQPMETKKDRSSGARRKGSGKTVSSFYKQQLDDLMKILNTTDPAFIRCVVPNTFKKPGVIDQGLLMHQYRCNGVLAGIAITKKGFPNKVFYYEFKKRYNILAATAVANAKKDKDACKAVLDAIKLDSQTYVLGHTKVFFKAGILGLVEEFREDRIGTVLSWLQAQARGKATRLLFHKMGTSRRALICMQRAIRNWWIGKHWLWWQIWLVLKPKLKCSKFTEYKEKFQNQVKIAEENMDTVVQECLKVKEEHKRLQTEKQELQLALQTGDDAVEIIIEKTKKAEASVKDLEKQLVIAEKEVKAKDDLVASITQQSSKLKQEAVQLAVDAKELGVRVTAVEEEKQTKDHQIESLKAEVRNQEEMLAKLQKEKTSSKQSKQTIEEEMQVMQDKCNHLAKVKSRLEQALDECEDSLETEKKAKNNVERIRRRIESDLKVTQETLDDLQRANTELNQVFEKKNKELSALSAKIEDEQSLGSKFGRQLRELHARTQDLDEELILERQERAKAEKTRQNLAKDIEDICNRLDDEGNSANAQMQINQKREEELHRLKAELEDSCIKQESTLAALRQKHNAMASQMGEQIDSLNKSKNKAEQDKAHMEKDLMEQRAALEEALREKANLERIGKTTQGMVQENINKLNELARIISDTEHDKKKAKLEHDDLERQIEETENAIRALKKTQMSLSTQIDDTNKLASAEAYDKSKLLNKLQTLNTEMIRISEMIDEQSEKKEDSIRALSKATADVQLWQTKYETEGLARVEELEASRVKLNARISEAELTIESMSSKIAATENVKHRMETENDDLQAEYDRIRAAIAINERRAANFDKVIGEWQAKVSDLNSELEASTTESRNYNSELFRVTAAHNEVLEQYDVVKRENKNLASEIKDLLEQLGDGGRSIHELDKQRRRLEAEKDELQAALEEAEAALEQEENKVLRSQLELGQMRQEIDRKLQEKNEEFENTKRNHLRAMESIQASLDGEVHGKNEALKVKRLLESTIKESEMALDQANRANVEGQKSVKRYQSQLRDIEASITDTTRERQALIEKVNMADRKANALSGELEESRALLNSCEHGNKQVQMELEDARTAVNDMTTINAKFLNEKRTLESTVHSLHAEWDDLVVQAKNSEEKAKKAMIDAARLSDELRAEQEHCHTQEMARKGLDHQMSELNSMLVETEDKASKTGRSQLSQMEAKIREMEIELSTCQSRTSEASKAHKKAERCIKELEFQLEEDNKNQSRMVELNKKLQEKIKVYKHQIEEAEEIAALNLAKYRKAQQELEEAEERSNLAGLQFSTSGLH